MLIDVIKVKVLDGYNLSLQFSDGKEGLINIKDNIEFKGIMEPLKDYNFFSSVEVNNDIGTICWKNGADIAPDFLYSRCI